MERTNAMHVDLPEPVALVTIDVAWTRQRNILPAARKILAPGGRVVTLIKPHYEAPAALLKKGVLPESALDAVLESVKQDITAAGFTLRATTRSPLLGGEGNIELLALLTPA
jgi:23S rRNA (cytidine1920-2'-O)/16S rRNA (cytidine1409-2'-O)-methyltransferase